MTTASYDICDTTTKLLKWLFFTYTNNMEIWVNVTVKNGYHYLSVGRKWVKFSDPDGSGRITYMPAEKIPSEMCDNKLRIWTTKQMINDINNSMAFSFDAHTGEFSNK